jgi:hypothetical protein
MALFKNIGLRKQTLNIYGRNEFYKYSQRNKKRGIHI